MSPKGRRVWLAIHTYFFVRGGRCAPAALGRGRSYDFCCDVLHGRAKDEGEIQSCEARLPICNTYNFSLGCTILTCAIVRLSANINYSVNRRANGAMA